MVGKEREGRRMEGGGAGGKEGEGREERKGEGRKEKGERKHFTFYL